MNTEERNENILNQMINGLSFNGTMVAAGAALLGGGFYYYLNNNKSVKFNSILDYKNQTREVAVNNFHYFIESLNTYKSFHIYRNERMEPEFHV
jgi:hypothetical protein